MKAMQAVEDLRYREEHPENWRLHPINFGGGNGKGYDRQIAHVVALIGEDEWALLNGLRALNILTADEYFARLYKLVTQKTSCTRFSPYG